LPLSGRTDVCHKPDFRKIPQLGALTETVYLSMVSAGTSCLGSRVALSIGSASAGLSLLRMSTAAVERILSGNIAFRSVQARQPPKQWRIPQDFYIVECDFLFRAPNSPSSSIMRSLNIYLPSNIWPLI